MEYPRLPRFERAATIAPIELTKRDREIIRLVHRNRFLRSSHIVSLVGGSAQQLVRRLQLLFHHGYADQSEASVEGRVRRHLGTGILGAREKSWAGTFL